MTQTRSIIALISLMWLHLFQPQSSPTQSVLFAEWASSPCPPPDPQTIEKHVNAMVEAVFKNYDNDRDGYISHEEFEAVAGNFPFIASFCVLDADQWVLTLLSLYIFAAYQFTVFWFLWAKICELSNTSLLIYLLKPKLGYHVMCSTQELQLNKVWQNKYASLFPSNLLLPLTFFPFYVGQWLESIQSSISFQFFPSFTITSGTCSGSSQRSLSFKL